jgi:hypothetical protein
MKTPRQSFVLPVLAGASALAILALPRALAQAAEEPDPCAPVESVPQAGADSADATPGPADAKSGSNAIPAGRARGLVRVLPGERIGVLDEPFDADRARADLTDADLDRRLAAFERAVERARHDSAAHGWLEELAAKGQGELAWTARLALREVRERQPQSPFDVWSGKSDLDEFERMVEEFSERFAPGWNHRLDPLAIPFPGLGQTPVAPGTSSSSRRVDVRNDAGGWVIRITEGEDGEESVREFRGETLEEILEANPELKDQVGISGALLGPGLSLRIGSPKGERFDFSELFGNLGVRPGPGPGIGGLVPRAGDGEPIRTDILGVYARPASPEEGGEGLYVRSTVPGTIAPLLGIRPGDVLLAVNGRELETLEDVSTALRERADDGRVEAAWRDARGRHRTGTWRP